jgi:hypothetical protein
MTAAERMAATRKRRAQEGIEEVRGIWAYTEDHPAIKEHAAKLTAKTAKRKRKADKT